MTKPFTVRVTVRVYETDTQGHLNANVYLQYAEHARWELLRAAGIHQSDLLAKGVSPVSLESTIKYHREVVAGDDIDVSCAFVFGEGKSFRVEQAMTRPDGTLVAEVFNVGGILDLNERRLVPNPREYFRGVAADPDVAGL
ncbi:acyl-CoA thioesterase [Streptomyces violens]|uniref:acyl-CoA thioesterase n=1 Tax=Streptomyces violens TaxID=66377 RepID=UPI0004C2586E|nr:thioesterase family protein [Streptomyces violens]